MLEGECCAESYRCITAYVLGYKYVVISVVRPFDGSVLCKSALGRTLVHKKISKVR